MCCLTMDKLYIYIFLFTSSRVDDGKKIMRYDYDLGWMAGTMLAGFDLSLRSKCATKII